MSRPRPTRTAVLPVLGAALLLSACGGGGGAGTPKASASGGGASAPSDASSTGSGASGAAVPDTGALVAGVTKAQDLAAGLPAALRSGGSLKIGSNVQSPPNNFYAADGKTPVGFEVDLITAVGNKLGLKVAYSDMAFDSLITSLQTGRVNATIAGMNDTPAREQKVDFVDYFTSGITIMVQKGNPAKIGSSGDLCGKKIAVVQGTTQEDFATKQSADCTSAGKPALAVTATPSDAQNQTQLRTGRVDAILNDLPSAVYISKTAGGGKYFQTVDQPPINGGPYGIGVPKSAPQLTASVQKALQALVADGTYGKILAAWDVKTGAVEKVTVNRA